MSSCLECGISVWKKWNNCPGCGRTLRMTTSSRYLMYMHDAAQLNRVETMLKAIMKHLEIPTPSELCDEPDELKEGAQLPQ